MKKLFGALEEKVNKKQKALIDSTFQKSKKKLPVVEFTPKLNPLTTLKFVYVKVEDGPIEKVRFDDPQNIFDKILPNLKSQTIDGKLVILFSKAQVGYKLANPNPLCCAYNATNEFITSWLGRRMDNADKVWYSKHPKVIPSGLPEQHTLLVLQELVLPYEIGISKVVVPPNAYLHPENRIFQEALGVNPIALTDKSTNNDEYLKIISGGDQAVLASLEDEVFSSFRFEYSALLPQGPFVVFVGSQTEAGGGHASYLSPRGNVPDFKMAIQYDFLKNISYKVSIPSANYTESEVKKIIDFWSCKDVNGKVLMTYKTFSVPRFDLGPEIRKYL